jgi:class 3 adenylate cyclase
MMSHRGNHETRPEFVQNAERIAQSFNDRIHANLLALDSFSISSTSYALDTESSWPLITVPDFAIRSWTTREEMKAETLGLLPIVTADKRQEWENYVVENYAWIEDAREWEVKKGKSSNPSIRSLLENTTANRESMIWNRNLQREANFSSGISNNIYTVNMEGAAVVDEGIGPFSPIWMTSPAPRDSRMINFNMLSHHLFWQAIEDCMFNRLAVLSRVLNFESNEDSEHAASSSEQEMEDPVSSIFYPVFDSFEDNSNLVAVVAAEIHWRSLLENSLTDSETEVVCVIETACDQIFSFKIDGQKATFLGPGNHHNPELRNMVQTRGPKELIEKAEGYTGTPLDLGHCPFLLHMYPTSVMKGKRTPFGVISLVSCLFASLIFVELLRMYRAKRSVGLEDDNNETTKVHHVPIKTLRRRITGAVPKLWKKGSSRSDFTSQRVEDLIRKMPDEKSSLDSAESMILTNSTLMVAGICSLDKWRNEKEAEELTQLLETVHRSLCVVAERHGISQVEKIDDIFLAAAGSNDCDVDHAASLVYFACECRKRISELFKSVSAKDLSIRFGIHSGYMKPETTSIVEGGNRFQLFGDTVDIAHQMLENGKPNRIQVSIDTAELLNLGGKSDWVSPRSDFVTVKGVGNMSTFWVKPKACLSTGKTNKTLMDQKNDIVSTSKSIFDGMNWEGSYNLTDISEPDFQSLVDRNTAILLCYLRAIHAKRLASNQNRLKSIIPSWDSDIEIGGSIIEEAKETVQSAIFDFKVAMNPVDPSLIEISQQVQSQLRRYVTSIGAAYRRENAFHNFQHASHSVLSIDHMIRKIMSSSDILLTGFDGKPRTKGEIAQELDGRTFSIHSDPVTQFAMVFSALIHNVDHMGVSNQQLIKHGSPLATLYKKRCVSEQNSVDISWWLLMKTDFDDLRSAIYSDASEKRRFRQIVVNSVIATDILDSKMKQHRENNWNKAFVRKATPKRHNFIDEREKRNVQLTAIVESIMQVADTSYRAQSYRTYVKWNERLFEETLKAYHVGSIEVNPVAHWYKSELNNFDNVLIPLLSRLTKTGVFGGSGESCLTQVSDNRNAWKSGGEVIVKEMVENFSRKVVAVQEDTIHFS